MSRLKQEWKSWWLVLVTAAAMAPAAEARASGMAAFRLYHLDNPAAAPVNEVIALVLPTGSVVPRDLASDPPTILSDSTGYQSFGFDPQDLEVTLGNGSLERSDGTLEPFQAIRLDFGPGGLAAGGKLFFQLKWSPSYDPLADGLIRLVLPIDVTNLAIETIELADQGGGEGPQTPGGNPPPTGNVPEPLSILMWASALLLGACRAGYFRHRRAHAAAVAT